MTCEICLALTYGPDDPKALVVAQAATIDRLTQRLVDQATPADMVKPKPQLERTDATAALETALALDDVYRKPARVAAPRLLEHLRCAGWTLTQENP